MDWRLPYLTTCHPQIKYIERQILPSLEGDSPYSQIESKTILNIYEVARRIHNQNTNFSAYWFSIQQAAFAPVLSSEVKITPLQERAFLFSLSYTIFCFHSFPHPFSSLHNSLCSGWTFLILFKLGQLSTEFGRKNCTIGTRGKLEDFSLLSQRS